MKKKIFSMLTVMAMLVVVGMLTTSVLAGEVDYTLVLSGGKIYADNDLTDNENGVELTPNDSGITGKINNDGSYTYTFDYVYFETTATTAVEIKDKNATIEVNDGNDIYSGDSETGANTYGIYASDPEGTITISGGGGVQLPLSGTRRIL